MDEFLELLTDSDFMFFVDDLDHAFQLQLIKAQYRGLDYAQGEPANTERSVLRDFRFERPIL